MWDSSIYIMDQYLKKIAQKYTDTQTSEMGYRTDFENLLETIFTKEEKYHIHHDAKSVGGNKPDFVVLKNAVPILYIEAKDIGIDLNKTEKSNQMDRYFGYDNLILTDYVEFRFYRNGEQYAEPISIASYDKNTRTIEAIPQNFYTLEKTIIDFTLSHKEPIRRGKHLAKIMGGKAQRIRDNVREMLSSQSDRYADLNKMQDVVRDNLVATLDDGSFADMYAQTLVYGLFAARYNDTTADTFSRTEARDLVPKTNPFLRSFFDHIAGTSFPERLRFIVDELCEVFTHANVHELMHEYFRKESLFGEVYETPDPVIHFYEDFLKEYDIKKKMEMGVFYTPRPVVQFIVRAVDSILKTEFDLEKGLSDTTKISIDQKEIDPKTGKEKKIKKEYHKVQVLDVATGTGTFLNETILEIYKSFKGQEGRWESYVKDDLLPRLHGFELMMASYTIAHLKLGMTIQDTGVKDLNQRLGVYLTNTLEEPKDYSNQGSLFGLMDTIAEESKNASRIKSEYPIMCVIGNPPYAINSSNKGEYINDLIGVYKQNLNEKNIQPLSDDYIKFIRFAENLVEKNNEGIVAMITNNSFIDGVIHRQMRKHLLETFDSVYILDLHGNARKGEKNIDGSLDQNVFDIMQGVSINIFIKTNKKEKGTLGSVYNYNLYGDRKYKYNFLKESTMNTILWNKLDYLDSYYFFIKKDTIQDRKNLFSLDILFKKYSSGITTGNDKKFVNLDKSEDFSYKYYFKPLDYRYINYDLGNIQRPRFEVMKNYIDKDNLALILQRGGKGLIWSSVSISNTLSDKNTLSAQTYNLPLYIYTDQNEKISNFDKDIWDRINKLVGKTTPENILDYVYAILHSPNYREKYKDLLNINFPEIPYPETKDQFWYLVAYGTKLRELHLFRGQSLNKFMTTFSINGLNKVEKVSYKNENVYINETQYFGDVPQVAWDFYIGGYQPAQKWLKDRKGRTLSNSDIEHYQKIIVVLTETDKLMNEIDKVV